MPSFAEIASRLYRQLLGIPLASQSDEAGITTLLEGSAAVATVEAILSEVSVSAASFPPEPGAIAWRGEQQRQQLNLFGQPLQQMESESPRASLSNAMGLAMAGKRAHCSLWSSDLAAAQDLLRRAVGHHLPLVIHTIQRALPLQGESSGGSHQSLHQLRESGAIILFAQNGQQAVDFTLIAHAVAEQALLPVVVAMDGEETAFSLQTLQLPSPQLIQTLVGNSSDTIPLEDPAQKMLFGEQRRRIPCWHNLDRPTLQGAHQDRYSSGLGEIAHSQFFGHPVNGLLEQTFEQFQQLTGRSYGPLSYEGAYKSLKLIVAQGAITERLEQIVKQLNEEQRAEIAIIGIQQIAPQPTTALRKLLQRADQITVFDATESLLDEAPPLYQTVMALASSSCRIHSILYGVGGRPLHTADLLAACQLPINRPATTLRLGIDPLPENNNPKQQAQHDQLLRYYPELKQIGLRSSTPYPQAEGGCTVAIIHRNHTDTRNLCSEIAQQLYQTQPVALRSQQQRGWSDWGESAVDCFHFNRDMVAQSLDPALPIDIALLTGHRAGQGIPAMERMHSGTTLLVDLSDDTPEHYLDGLPAAQRNQLQQLGTTLLFIEHSVDQSDEEIAATRSGTLFSQILQRGTIELREGRLVEHYPHAEAKSAFQAALEPLAPYPLSPATAHETALPQQTPMAVRHLRQDDENIQQGYHTLSRFWDQTGVLYRDGRAAHQGIDPYMATGHIPPLSSTFNNHSQQAATRPQFDPLHCSGCGDCWSYCPDSAIGATALTPGQLLEAGMKMGGADALRPHLSKLTKVLSTVQESGDSEILVREGWKLLMEQAPLSGERRSEADAAIEQLSSNLGTLPLVLTQTLFSQPEQNKPQSGQLLTLVVNPDNCKGCGLCTAFCAEEAARQQQEQSALQPQPNTTEALQQQYQQWRIWEQLPDTAAATLDTLADEQILGPLRSTLLSRYAGMAIGGGDCAEPGSGEKLILRQLLGITESKQQPLVHQQLHQLEDLYQKLMTGIREQLATASHIDDLSALAEGLGELSNRNLTLSTLAEKTADIEGDGIDAYTLKEWIELADAIQQEQQQIASGDQSLGRARYSLAFANGSITHWAANFPHNPFEVPVTVANGAEIAALTAGLMEGQLEQATHTQRLMQQAKSLLKGASTAERQEMDKIGWRDLTPEARQQCAPLLLVGNDNTLGAAGSSGLSWLLNSDLPIKVVVLADLDLGCAGAEGLHGHSQLQQDARSELALNALSQRNAYVAQSSMADPAHLHQSMREALQFDGPALLRIHAPSPQRHGFDSDETVAQAALAVSSHAFPLFRYDPEQPGVFGSRIDLSGNPEEAVDLTEWAYREARFAGLFAPLTDEKGPTPLAQWATLDPRGQQSKTATCTIEGETYAIEPTFAQRLGQLQEQWQMLQELAGIVTPFTARVQQETETALNTAHQAEIEALKKSHQQELQALRDQLEGDVASRITHRLVTLTEQYQEPGEETTH